MSVILPCIRQEAYSCFSLSRFCFHAGRRKNPADITYLTISWPVHGEHDGASCISLDDCIRKLHMTI